MFGPQTRSEYQRDARMRAREARSLTNITNAINAGNVAEAYTFRGNFTYLRVYMDRAHVGDGTTYDTSYGSISKAILSA